DEDERGVREQDGEQVWRPGRRAWRNGRVLGGFGQACPTLESKVAIVLGSSFEHSTPSEVVSKASSQPSWRVWAPPYSWVVGLSYDRARDDQDHATGTGTIRVARPVSGRLARHRRVAILLTLPIHTRGPGDHELKRCGNALALDLELWRFVPD